MIKAEPGVLLLDDRRVFVAANEVVVHLLGTADGDLLGRRADEFMPPVARALYPLAWRGFMAIGTASGEYAARLGDGSLQHLAYVGFANRPVRGLHFFVVEPLPGSIAEAALEPVPRESHIQVGLDLGADVRARLVREADRAEWRLPVAKGGERAVVAALFADPAHALDTLDALREIGSVEAGIATAAGATTEHPLTVLGGRVPYSWLGRAIEEIRARSGRVLSHVDERRV